MAEEGIIIPSFSLLDIAVWGTFATIGGVLFTVYKTLQSQKETKKIEFMKQIEYYDTEMVKNKLNFKNPPQKYEDCVSFAKTHLTILDRLSFLKTKNIVTQDFIQFFENDFNFGKTLLAWLKFTNRRPVNMDLIYSHFLSVKDTIVYDYLSIVIDTSFYYYAHKFKEKTDYKPEKDDFNPKIYCMTVNDRELLKF